MAREAHRGNQTEWASERGSRYLDSQVCTCFCDVNCQAKMQNLEYVSASHCKSSSRTYKPVSVLFTKPTEVLFAWRTWIRPVKLQMPRRRVQYGKRMECS